jgi:hypothetical protein
VGGGGDFLRIRSEYGCETTWLPRFIDKELADVGNYVTGDYKEFTNDHPVVIIVLEFEGCKAVYNC